MSGILRCVAALVVAGCGSSSGADPDAGAQGDGSLIDGGAEEQASREDAVRACLFLGGCAGDGVADCFTDLLPALSPTTIACVLDAGTDCAAVRACLGFLGVEVDPECTPSCDGDILVSCGDGARSTLDCNAYFEMPGTTCLIGNFGPECGAGTCDQEESMCDGDAVLLCDVDRGVYERGDCGHLGLSCVEDGGAARCSDGRDVACSGEPDRCDGDSLVRCSSEQEVAIDCGFLVDSRSCYQTETAGAFCGFGDTCDPQNAKGEETCDGTVITFCAGGAVESIDCAELGFTGCTESIGGGHCTVL